MHIILHQPEIPANTGNIGRTCAATGVSLHLIEPLGFRLNEKEIRRAGMDYWEHLDVTRYMNFDEFKAMHPDAKIWMATTKARQTYSEVSYGPDDFIMFGKESAGIPEELLVDYEKTCIRIPMLPQIHTLYVPLIFPIPWPLSSMKPCASRILRRCSLRADFTD